VVGGPTSSNPFGHVAIATTGSGIYSYGTGTDTASSVSDYLLNQAQYRDSAAYILDTTAAQEAAILKQLQTFPQSLPHVPGPDSHDTCATRTNKSLRRGGIQDPFNPYADLGLDSNLPAASAIIALAYGASVVRIPQGTTSIPAVLNQFNPH
jgi:hypothetical protein